MSDKENNEYDFDDIITDDELFDDVEEEVVKSGRNPTKAILLAGVAVVLGGGGFFVNNHIGNLNTKIEMLNENREVMVQQFSAFEKEANANLVKIEAVMEDLKSRNAALKSENGSLVADISRLLEVQTRTANEALLNEEVVNNLVHESEGLIKSNDAMTAEIEDVVAENKNLRLEVTRLTNIAAAAELKVEQIEALFAEEMARAEEIIAAAEEKSQAEIKKANRFIEEAKIQVEQYKKIATEDANLVYDFEAQMAAELADEERYLGE